MRLSKREPFYSLSPGLGKRETTPVLTSLSAIRGLSHGVAVGAFSIDLTEIAPARHGSDLTALECSRRRTEGNDLDALFVWLTGGRPANLPLSNGHAMLKGPRKTGEV